MASPTLPSAVTCLLEEFSCQLRARTVKNEQGQPCVLVEKLKKWLRAVSNDGPVGDRRSTSRFESLLHAAYYRERQHHTGPPVVPGRLEDGIVVFCILLELKRGNLIDLFLSHNVVDSKLPESEDRLNEILQRAGTPGATTIATEFHQVQKQFTIRKFARDLGAVYEPDEILPIAKRKIRSKKGATAEIYSIYVH